MGFAGVEGKEAVDGIGYLFRFGKVLVFRKRLNTISDEGAEFIYQFLKLNFRIFKDVMQKGTLDGEVVVFHPFDREGGDDLLADEDGVDNVGEIRVARPGLDPVGLGSEKQGAAGEVGGEEGVHMCILSPE